MESSQRDLFIGTVGTVTKLRPPRVSTPYPKQLNQGRVAVISAKNYERQRRKRQSVTAKRVKSQTPKVSTAILTIPNLT